MQEPKENLGHICPQCSEERRLSWQEHHAHLILHSGDYVKIRIQHPEGGEEWMWAEVIHSRAVSEGITQLYGVWRNDAVLGAWPRYGDPATFLRTDIADYCSQGDFDDWTPWRDPINHEHSHPHEIN